MLPPFLLSFSVSPADPWLEMEGFIAILGAALFFAVSDGSLLSPLLEGQKRKPSSALSLIKLTKRRVVAMTSILGWSCPVHLTFISFFSRCCLM